MNQAPNGAPSSLILPGLSSNVLAAANLVNQGPAPSSMKPDAVQLTGDAKRSLDPSDMSHASVQVLARLISDQVNRISAMNKVSDEIIKLQEIESKDICEWPHNELVHWILTFKNKRFSKYVGNVIANSLDGNDMANLSKRAMVTICDGNEIHGELLYKFIKQKTKLKVDRKRSSETARVEQLQNIMAKFGDAVVNPTGGMLTLRDGTWVKRKRRCKVAILTRDLINYIESFERIMKKGRLSMNAAAEQHDAPISRGSYRNYVKIRQQLVDMGYDLSDKAVLDAPFKELIKSRSNKRQRVHKVQPVVSPVPPVPSVPNVTR